MGNVGWRWVAVGVLALAGCGPVGGEVSLESELDGETDEGGEGDVESPEGSMDPEAAERFTGWLEGRVRHPDVALYHAYFEADEGRAWFVSTMASAEVLRFYLRLGEKTRATEIGEALLAFQHDGKGPAGPRLSGAFPSELEERGGRLSPRYLYDSGDNLTVIEALLDLHEATGNARYLEAALRTGAWLRDVMARGERFALFVEPLGVPMKAVTDAGDFDNRIAVGRTAFWLPTLRRLASVSGDVSFAELADRAAAFFAKAQDDTGAIFDHYDPGFPPLPFDVARFRPYGEDGSVVGDDSIRAALGLASEGRVSAALRFAAWLRAEDGKVPGYLSFETGGPHAPPGSPKYYDVFSTSLWRALAADLGLGPQPGADALIARAQGDNGGFFWGWDPEADAPLADGQATLVGLWALSDLRPTP